MAISGAAIIAALSLVATIGVPAAQAQRGRGGRPPQRVNPGLGRVEPQRPNLLRPNVQRAAPRRDARKMLIRMVRAENGRAFMAREVSFTVNGGTVEYLVKRDPRMGLRRESTKPPGELLIDNYRSSWYSSQRGQRFVESNSTLFRGKPEEVIRRFMGDQLIIEWVGQDKIAGRATDIISVVPDGVAAPSRRFWVDRATGLRLKTEEYDPNGRLLSSAYVLDIDLNPVLNNIDFAKPGTPVGAKVTRQANQKFRTVEAAARAGFASRIPMYLPYGFNLTGVIVVNGGERITQNYSNGLNLISLTQTTKSWGRRMLSQLDANQSGFISVPRDDHAYTWRIGNMVYVLIDKLADSETLKIAASVR